MTGLSAFETMWSIGDKVRRDVGLDFYDLLIEALIDSSSGRMESAGCASAV